MKLISNIILYLHELINLCPHCHRRKVIWYYMPGKNIACDECVPRGCSCNTEPIDGNPDNLDPLNWEEETDEQGRKYPCCEWMRFDD